MKLSKGCIYIGFLIAIVAAGLAFTWKYAFKAKDDNLVEETCEKIIKNETGIDLDLTPTTTEESEEG